MGVKYVKDFSFPSSGGFHGDVQRYAKGGHVTKMPAKAKASAKDMPARAKPNAPAKGAPKMASKPAVGKRQGYDKGGRVPGREMDRLPTKRPPGRMKDLAPARRFKGDYQGYAEGGPVDEILPGDGRGGLEAGPRPPVDPVTGEYGDMMPDYESRLLGGDLRDLEMIGRPVPMPEDDFIVNLDSHYRLNPNLPPVGALTPLPEEPNYNDPRYVGPGQLVSVERDVFGRSGLNRGPAAFELPAPRTRADIMADRREMVGARGARRVAREPMARRMAAPKPAVNRLLQPYMPTYDFSQEPIPAGFVASPEARYANGGMIENFTTGQGMDEAAGTRAQAPMDALRNRFSPPLPVAYAGPYRPNPDREIGMLPGVRRGVPVKSSAEAKAQTAVAKQRLADMQARSAKLRAENEAKRAASAARVTAARAKLSPATRAASEKFQSDLRARALANVAARRGQPTPVRATTPVPEEPMYFKNGGQAKIGKVMREYKAGKLHSGSKKGPKVTSEKQAMAIALSEARKAGAKIPKKAEGGIFSNEDMAYESKGPKTRYSAARSRRESKERAMERRALDKARHAEMYAPGKSLDMADRKNRGGMPVHRRKPMYGGGKC